jgi:hypothetical protein
MAQNSAMTFSEAARLALYTRPEEVLGHENADTLMMSLPSYGAENLATKTDIDRLDNRFDRLEDRFDRLEDRLDRQGERMENHFRTYTVTTVGAMTGLTAIFAVVVSLLS